MYPVMTFLLENKEKILIDNKENKEKNITIKNPAPLTNNLTGIHNWFCNQKFFKEKTRKTTNTKVLYKKIQK